MFIELVLGILVGIISKEIIKLRAKKSSNMQVFSSSNYCSIEHQNNLPKLNFYNLFNLKPNLVIVSYFEEQIIREDFYTFLGDRTSTIYQDGIFVNSFWELLGSPIYIFTAVAPLVIGLSLGILLSFSSPLETFFTYLFISGFLWGSVIGLLYPLLYREPE